MREYPPVPFVVTISFCAAIFMAAEEITPISTTVAFEPRPVLVVSAFVQPVVFPVLMAVLLAIPAIVNVSVGSTTACTMTELIVPIFTFVLSSTFVLAS